MKHSDLRLRQRALPAEGDRAFALVRDRQALARFVVDTAGPGDEDVALALSPGARAAHLVVSRQGKARTCLAANMAPLGRVVSFDLVDAYLRAQDAELALKRALHAHEEIDLHARPLVRLTESAHTLVREDMVVLERLFPLVEDDVLFLAAQALEILSAVRARPGLILDDDAVRALWRMIAFLRTAIVLGKDSPRFDAVAAGALALDDASVALPALFTLAQAPERTLAIADAVGDDGGAFARALVVIALRYPAHRKDARAACARRGAAVDDALKIDDGRAKLVFLLVLPALLGRFCPRAVREMPPAERHERIAAVRAAVEGTDVPLRAVAERLDPWFARVVDALDPERWLHHPSPQVAPAAIAHQGERVRTHLWRKMVRDCPLSFSALPLEAAAFLSAAPLAALLPGERRDPALRDGAAPARVARFLGARASVDERAPRPAQSAKKPGRNEPCPCGSGKKYKHCHGTG